MSSLAWARGSHIPGAGAPSRLRSIETSGRRAAMATNLRGVVVGASTLLGKELIEELNTSETGWDLRIADTGDTSGQLLAGGDEALVVQSLTPDIFEARDVAFFTAE